MFFKQRLQKKALNRIVVQRKVQFVSLESVKRISFIFDVTEEDNMEAVKFLISYATDNKIEYHGIAINLGKDTSSEAVLGHGIKLITKKNLSKIGIPDPDMVSKFLNDASDIYIDFSKSYSFVGEYLSLSSLSSFKVGRHSHEPNPYDLVITNDSDKCCALDFVKRTFFYLKTIRSL
ncbi:MAG: hypothetical protein VB022_06015 [Rikenellaceae bacterium]|nr:hypothetical protein [Rikenellaceae bacterium]